jgi:hypothetical protein
MLKCWLNKSSSFSAVSQNPFSIVQLSSLLRRYLSEPASAAPQAALPQTELVTPVLHPTSAESSTSPCAQIHEPECLGSEGSPPRRCNRIGLPASSRSHDPIGRALVLGACIALEALAADFTTVPKTINNDLNKGCDRLRRQPNSFAAERLR